jgi:hypothetical protein
MPVQGWGIIGRDVLNHVCLVLDGSHLTWREQGGGPRRIRGRHEFAGGFVEGFEGGIAVLGRCAGGFQEDDAQGNAQEFLDALEAVEGEGLALVADVADHRRREIEGAANLVLGETLGDEVTNDVGRQPGRS